MMIKGSGKTGETAEGLMTLAAFRDMLDIHGAAMRRWPVEQRSTAQALLTRSAEARDVLREAAALDALLDGMPDPQVDEARVALVVAGALGALPVPGHAAANQRKRAKATSGWERLAELLQGLMPSPAWSRAAGLATCTASGLLVGMLAPMTATSADATQTPTAIVTHHGDYGTGIDLTSAVLSPYSLESLFQ
jgi:hypothetical protein